MSGYQYPQGYPNPQTQAQVPQFPGFPGAAPASAAGYAQAGYPAPAHAQPPATAGYPPQPPGVGPVWQAPGPGVPAVPGYGGPVPAPAPQPAYAPAPQAQYPPQVQPAAAGGLPPSYTDVISHDFARVNISFNPAAPYPAPTPKQQKPAVAAVPVAPTAAAAAAGDIWGLLQHEAKIHLVSAASKKSLRILAGGEVNGQGGQGAYATFHVEHPQSLPHDIIRLRNANNPAFYLNIMQGQLLASNGATNTSLFRVIPHGGSVISLESVSFPGQHVGVLPNGRSKPSANTGRGPHGQFTVQPAGQAPGQVDVWGMLLPEARIRLVSAASGKTLRILGDGRVNGLGGNGQAAMFFVELPQTHGPGIIRLRNANNPQFYLNILQGQLMGSNGATDTSLLRVHAHGGDLISLESLSSHGQHVGILPSGQPKPATGTGRGKHGQFIVQRAA